MLPEAAFGGGSSQLRRRGSSRPPSWLSSPSQPVLYLDIDNPNSSPNQLVMDSTGSTLFIYHLSQLQSSVSLPSPGLLGRHLSFSSAGQCSSATSSSVAVHPLPNTARQMRCFKQDEMGDLVLFSPNGAALRRTNTSVLHPPFWPHGPGTPCCGCLHEQQEGTSLFVFMSACTCRYVHTCMLSNQCVFLKFGNAIFFPSPSTSEHCVSPMSLRCSSAGESPSVTQSCAPQDLCSDHIRSGNSVFVWLFRPEKFSQPLY